MHGCHSLAWRHACAYLGHSRAKCKTLLESAWPSTADVEVLVNSGLFMVCAAHPRDMWVARYCHSGRSVVARRRFHRTGQALQSPDILFTQNNHQLVQHIMTAFQIGSLAIFAAIRRAACIGGARRMVRDRRRNSDRRLVGITGSTIPKTFINRRGVPPFAPLRHSVGLELLRHHHAPAGSLPLSPPGTTFLGWLGWLTISGGPRRSFKFGEPVKAAD